MSRLLAAVASTTPKQFDRSQDRASTFSVRNSAAQRGVVVADGVGEFEDSGIVASRAVEYAVAELSHGPTITARGYLLRSSTQSVVRAPSTDGILGLADHVNQRLQEDLPLEGATTLVALVASALNRWVLFSLAGNGAVLEFGYVPIPGGSPRVLWAEHALPGVGFDRGRETLRSFLPYPGEESLLVAEGRLRMPRGETRLLVACSDGVTSLEARRVGVNADGSTWLEIPAPLAILTRTLAAWWPQLTARDATDVDLENFLRCCLDEALAARALDDDATLGALLLPAEQPDATP